MIERCEETQAVIPMKQGLFDLHLPAWQRSAGRKALWAGQKLHPGGDFVFYCLQALFLCTWSCTHTVGLCGKKGIHVKDVCISLAWVFFSKNNPSKLSRNSYIDAIKNCAYSEMKLVKRSPQIHKEKPQSLWDLSYALTSKNLLKLKYMIMLEKLCYLVYPGFPKKKRKFWTLFPKSLWHSCIMDSQHVLWCGNTPNHKTNPASAVWSRLSVLCFTFSAASLLCHSWISVSFRPSSRRLASSFSPSCRAWNWERLFTPEACSPNGR